MADVSPGSVDSGPVLVRQTFLGIFNILLWSCVVAEAWDVPDFKQTEHRPRGGPVVGSPGELIARSPDRLEDGNQGAG